MRFRNQLLLLVLSILIPAFLAASWAVWYVYRNEQAKQEANLQETARSFAMIVESDLKIREATLRTLANSPVLATGDLHEFYNYAKLMAPTPESTIVLKDELGRQLLNTRRPFGTTLPITSANNVDALRKLRGPDDTIVSDLFLAQVAKRFDFAIQVPVRQNSHRFDVLNMGVNASALQPILMQQQFPDSWITTILDRNGVVLARSLNPEQFVGKPTSERTRKIVSESRGGVYHSVTLDGVPVKAFYSRVPIADWSVLISVPESEISHTAIRAGAILAAVMVFLLGFAVAAAGWLARRAVRPIEALGRSAEQMINSKEVAYVPHGVLEIDAVAQQIAAASAKIRDANRELEKQVAESSLKAERAERALQQGQKLEALGRLTGGIAHEFNNLLQTISSAVQLARLIPQPDRVQPLMDTCMRAIERATALTSQLSAFGRPQDAKIETICLREQLNSFKELARGTLPSNIEFDIRLSDAASFVSVDTLQFELAFLNIVINARDAMPGGGKLTIHTEPRSLPQAEGKLPAGDYVRICIADTGTGMSEEVMAKALEPFFTTKPLGKGTGLGLAQAYGFARQSNGVLLLHSEEGRGTTVEIFLPRVTAADGRGQSARLAGPDSAPPQARGTLLFVEDDSLVRSAMIPALQSAGLQVISATNGDEALAIFESGRQIDWVCSDVMMPGKLNGVDLARKIMQKDASVKIVLATGYSDYKIDLANVKVLAKPYQVADLVSLLQTS
jgi:signal transduction histidine kinase/CheY-like chemotaxis protein